MLSYLLEGQMIHRDSEGDTEKHKRSKLPSKPQMQKLRKVFRSPSPSGLRYRAANRMGMTSDLHCHRDLEKHSPTDPGRSPAECFAMVPNARESCRRPHWCAALLPNERVAQMASALIPVGTACRDHV